MNRREFMVLASAAVMCAVPVVANGADEPPADYGDPAQDFRHYNVDGVPASGTYRPNRDIADRWFERVGLPHTRSAEWSRIANQRWSKEKIRHHCNLWLRDHSHRCVPTDVTSG